jgi:hypothetical protein
MKKLTRHLVVRGETIRRLARVELASVVKGGGGDSGGGSCAHENLGLAANAALVVATNTLIPS